MVMRMGAHECQLQAGAETDVKTWGQQSASQRLHSRICRVDVSAVNLKNDDLRLIKPARPRLWSH